MHLNSVNAPIFDDATDKFRNLCKPSMQQLQLMILEVCFEF